MYIYVRSFYYKILVLENWLSLKVSLGPEYVVEYCLIYSLESELVFVHETKSTCGGCWSCNGLGASVW